jgi:hypothetical protein
MGAQLLRPRETPEDLVQSLAREALGELSASSNGAARRRSAIGSSLQRPAQAASTKRALRGRRDAATRRARRRPARTSSQALLACYAYATFCTPSGELGVRAKRCCRIESAFAELPEDYQEAISLQRLCGLDYSRDRGTHGRAAKARCATSCTAACRGWRCDWASCVARNRVPRNRGPRNRGQSSLAGARPWRGPRWPTGHVVAPTTPMRSAVAATRLSPPFARRRMGAILP